MNGEKVSGPEAKAWRHATWAGLVGLALSALLLPGCTSDDNPDNHLVTIQDNWPPAPEPALEVNDPALVRQAQQHLLALGHQPGSPDGVLGPQTILAIESYQAAKGFEVDGRLDEVLVAALKADQLALEAVAAPSVESLAATRKPKSVLPEPRYLPGSRYLYSNGTVYEVLATEGAEVRWRSNLGETFTKHRNFTLPPLAWTAGGLAGHRVLDVAPDTLWRQTALADAVFVATTTTRSGGGPESLNEQTEHWRCHLDGEETVTVLAGEFETQKLVCERFAADASLELERTWFYAPSLRHFVLRRDVAASGIAEAPPMELVAIQPYDLDWPPAARGGLARAMQHVLEKLPAGEELAWSSSGVEAEITIKAGDPVDLAGQGTCRRLQQTWTTAGDTWQFPRLACRDPDGKWRFPDAEEQQYLASGLPS
jgi:hypothetical protein